MHAGKPQKQAIAIAYAVKRKNAHKKASGGMVESGSRDMNLAEGGEAGVHKEAGAYGNPYGAPTSKKSAKREHKEVMASMPKPKLQGLAEGGKVSEDSARSESRPMPDKTYNDSAEAGHNRGNKAPGQDSWTDRPTEKQAISNNGRMVKPIKHPKMVPSDAFSVRLQNEEDDLMDSASPGPYGEQPPEHDNEEGPDRQGPKVPDMEDEHSTHRKPYAKGGMIDDMDHPSKHYMQPEDHGIQEQEREEEAHLQSNASPSEDEGSSDAHSRNEEGPDRQGPRVPDMEEPHSEHDEMFSDNERSAGESERHRMDEEHYSQRSPDDSADQPSEEEEMDHSASVAAAIMSKRRMRKEDGMSGSKDMNDAEMYALGGEILEDQDDIHSHGSYDTHEDVDQVDLSRNADEDANEEDQMSFDALRKENYSESDGLSRLDQPHDSNLKGDDEEDDEENVHDMDVVSMIRRNMKRRSPISR